MQQNKVSLIAPELAKYFEVGNILLQVKTYLLSKLELSYLYFISFRLSLLKTRAISKGGL